MSKEQIKEWNKAYRQGSPLVSDEEYDLALEELKKELGWFEYEDFIVTLTEGTDDSGTVKLDYVLGSLTKYKAEEYEKFVKWYKENVSEQCIISDKIDGCSFFASYRDGKLVTLASRGDGGVGTDWTDKAKYIKIPYTINFMGELDIRGELTLVNNDYVDLGFKNKRNGTVGIMNSKDINYDRLKCVHAYTYEILSLNGKNNFCMIDQLTILSDYGFRVSRYNTFTSPTLEELNLYYKTRKANAEYDIDGLVISDVNYKPENEFFPKGKIAFKINSTGVTTTVKGIEWNLSKGGLLKPVVLLEAVEIDGSTVQRATGYNAKYIVDNEIKIGSKVSIIKSGQIIPRIIKVINQ